MEKIPSVVVCFPARNEEQYLPQVLDSLKNQKIKPIKVFIANDGSTDDTEKICNSYDFVEVLNREKRNFTVVGKIEMGKVWNDSIRPSIELDKINKIDYILFLGADLVLPENYISDLIKKFEENPNLMVAAGKMIGEFAYKTTGFMTPGGGRMMRFSYWKKVGGLYPLKEGWESYPVYRAVMEGYESKIFPDIEYYPLRTTGGRTDYYAYGSAMKAYGYFFLYAWGRSLKQIFLKNKGLKASYNMLRGYLFSNPDKYEPELTSFINQIQKKSIKKIILRRS